MTRLSRLFLVALILTAISAAREGEAQNTNLLVGEPLPSGLQSIQVGQVRNYQLAQESTRINLSQAGVLSLFLPEPKLLSISGKQAGVVDISILYVDGSNAEFSVQVIAEIPKELKELAAELTAELKPIRGVAVTARDGRIVVTGHASVVDQKLYKSLLENYGNQIVDEVSFAPPQSNVDVIEEGFQGFDGNTLYTDKGSYQVGAYSAHGKCILVSEQYAVFEQLNGRQVWLLVKPSPGVSPPEGKNKSQGKRGN